MDTPPESKPSILRPKEQERLERELLAAIKTRCESLATLFTAVSGHWGFEDPIYRFYHQSFKVLHLEGTTQKIVIKLRALLPATSKVRHRETAEDLSPDRAGGKANRPC